MLGVSFFFESNIKNFASGTELAVEIWRECMIPWGITDLFVVDQDGLRPEYRGKQFGFHVYDTLGDLIDGNKKQTFVFCTVPRVNPDTTPLRDFEHPADAVYLFGPDSSVLDVSLARKRDSVIGIRTPERFAMWSIGAACAVMYDRFSKES
jgi:hypothetical protein